METVKLLRNTDFNSYVEVDLLMPPSHVFIGDMWHNGSTDMVLISLPDFIEATPLLKDHRILLNGGKCYEIMNGLLHPDNSVLISLHRLDWLEQHSGVLSDKDFQEWLESDEFELSTEMLSTA